MTRADVIVVGGGIGTEPPLALAGDGFGGSRVEGAWTSGRKDGGWLQMQLGGRPRDRSTFEREAMNATVLEENR